MAQKEVTLRGSVNTEAPASLTLKFYYRGYDSMLTIRDGDGRSLLNKLKAAVDELEQIDAKPQK